VIFAGGQTISGAGQEYSGSEHIGFGVSHTSVYKK